MEQHVPLFENFKKMVKEGYPAGAEGDPDAPWKHDDPQPRKNVIAKKYKYVAGDNEVIVVGDGQDKYVFFYLNLEPNVVKNIAIDYVGVGSTYGGKDEDGDPIIDYDTENYNKPSDLPHDAVVDYINDNEKYLSMGSGVGDWESGVELVRIDQALAEELKSTHPDLNF